MNDDEIEKERQRRKGDDFEQVVVEAYKKALRGKIFEFVGTDKTWYFLPKVGDNEDNRILFGEKDSSLGSLKPYTFHVDNGKIYLTILMVKYEFLTYSIVEDCVVAVLILNNNPIQLRQIVQ